jgi:hypothetical protein
MWRPLSLHAPFDVVFLVVVLPLLFFALRSRPGLWEAVAIAGLAFAAARSSRNEVWLVLFVAVPAARGIAGSRPWRVAVPPLVAGAVALLLAVLAVAGLARTPASTAATSGLLDRAVQAAHGTPILADGLDAEELALAGHRILIGNPLDAFAPREQQLYLDWLAGRPRGDAELARVRVVVVTIGSAAQRRLATRQDFVETARDRQAAVYLRVDRHASATHA